MTRAFGIAALILVVAVTFGLCLGVARAAVDPTRPVLVRSDP